MKLFIAEKPSLGRAIAGALGIVEKQQNHIKCKNDQIVTWCFGHLLELYMPEDYDAALKKWKRETLPIVPDAYKLKVSPKTKAQVAHIAGLLKKAQTVVNAGDPDREGQLLVDEVLEHCGWTGPTQRIWLAALDDKSIAKALAAINDNKQYAPLRDAARARSQADWLVGSNCTRAMSLGAQAAGVTGVQSLGRVQTPTLALVVRRDREIEGFKPHDYYRLRATFQGDSGAFSAVFQPAETQEGLDSEGRLIDAKIADSLIARVKGKDGRIIEVKKEHKKKAPPLPHCLSSLQKIASSKLGLSAKQTLDAAQALYEARLTTYPRTDCRYLPEEQYDDAAAILRTLAQIDGLKDIATNADPKIKSAAWDTKKITAHHAIIPTGEKPSASLAPNERKLYDLICKAYCVQFHAPCEYEARTIRVRVEETEWEAKGRRMLNGGWVEALAGDDAVETKDEGGKEGADREEMNAELPDLAEKASVACKDVEKQAKKTTPPPRYSEGSLIEAMSHVHRYVEDSEAKKTLKENEGIGTEATRAEIIETLKRNKFLEVKSKKIISTPAGRQLIDLCPEVIKDPVTTAQWETRLGDIVDGKETLVKFMQDQTTALGELVDTILEVKMETKEDAVMCELCGKALIRHAKGKYGPWWGCSGYPDCQAIYKDVDGKPRLKKQSATTDTPCPECGEPLKHNPEGKFGPYFCCENKSAHDGKIRYWNDVDGKPEDKKKSGGEETEFVCPVCKKPLQRREKDGEAYFACFNKEAHEGEKPLFWPELEGKPDFDKKKSGGKKGGGKATKFKCPVCKEPIQRREKDGEAYFACFNKEAHENEKPLFWSDVDGKPDFDRTSRKSKK